MNGNGWGVLVLLALAVLIAALVRSKGGKTGEGEPDSRDGAPDGKDADPANAEPSIDGRDAEYEAFGVWREEPELEPEVEVEPVPEREETDGLSIRRDAWRIFRAQYRNILPLAAVVAALGMIQSALQEAMPEPVWLQIPLNVALSAVFSLVTVLGAAFAATRLWKGEAPVLGMLTYFLQSEKRLRALGLMVLKQLVLLLPSLVLLGAAAMFAFFIPEVSRRDAGWMVFVAIPLLIAFACVSVWLPLRMAILEYALAIKPELRAIEAFRTGFGATKHRVGAVFSMFLATGWPLFLIGAVAPYAERLNFPYAQPIAMILTLLVQTFYGGYVMIAMAGLANHFMPEGPAEAAPVESADA